MKPFIEKLRALERQIAHEKGAFALFALFQLSLPLPDTMSSLRRENSHSISGP